MKDFLIESALLTHGLASIPNDYLIRSWEDGWDIAWMSGGKLTIGDIEEFCRFRDEAADFARINYFSYDISRQNGASGPLTASGTFRACMETGARVTVTCGLGGLRRGETAEASNDISAMKDAGISTVATAFKDMFDAQLSLEAAAAAGMSIYRLTDHWHMGYMFISLHDTPEPDYNEAYSPAALYLAPVPPDELIADRSILEEASAYGEEEALKGKPFHPAVNRRIDELTAGYSSELQLRSLITNIGYAKRLFAGKAK